MSSDACTIIYLLFLVRKCVMSFETVIKKIHVPESDLASNTFVQYQYYQVIGALHVYIKRTLMMLF